MRNYLLPLIALLLFWSCSSGTDEAASWQGQWKATWETDPASFAGIEGITHFTMDGNVTFEADKVNIKAFGFEGCAFGVDTLDHSLFWKVRNDSLILTNDEATPGMDYLIKEKTDKKIKLQLLEDIFLTLEK